MPDSENDITTLEQLEGLPLGTWLFDAKDEAWALFDTAILVRQRMWRSEKGSLYVNHESIPLPARLGEVTADCDHQKLTIEGWQCARCAAVINEPPPVPIEPETPAGQRWFYSDDFGGWCGMSPDFDNIIALAEDVQLRPHDAAARDRYEFEIAAMARVFAELSADDFKDGGDGTDGIHRGLSLVVSHLVARSASK